MFLFFAGAFGHAGMQAAVALFTGGLFSVNKKIDNLPQFTLYIAAMPNAPLAAGAAAIIRCSGDTLLTGALLVVLSGAMLWFFLPRNGEPHRWMAIPFVDAAVPLVVIIGLALGLTLLAEQML